MTIRYMPYRQIVHIRILHRQVTVFCRFLASINPQFMLDQVIGQDLAHGL